MNTYEEYIQDKALNDAHTEQVIKEIEQVRSLFESRNDKYKISPVVILPVESWLHQIRIKAERALQATSDEKRVDELRDCAVYCLLTLAKMQGEQKWQQ